MKQSVESNSFEKFKVIASLPILYLYFRFFFLKKRFLRKSSKPGNVVLIPFVPFNVSCSCSLDTDTLQKLWVKIAWVLATLHGWLKILLSYIVSNQKFDRLLGRVLSCCFFFDIKDLIYTYVKSVTRCCSNDIP